MNLHGLDFSILLAGMSNARLSVDTDNRSIERLYAPISSELKTVEAEIKKTLSSDQPYLKQLLAHVNGFGGKRIRPVILLLAARLTGGIKPDHLKQATIVELLHTATLVHDDVLDEARLRRNNATINASYGIESAVILGDYIFSKAFELCTHLDTPGAEKIIASTTSKMCVGETMQISRKYYSELTEDEYISIIKLKTASLFEACAYLAGVTNRAQPSQLASLREYAVNVGICFQIIDDILDITGLENVMGKSLGTDIEKGKMTLPCILLFKQLEKSERAKFKEVFESENGVADKRKFIRDLVNKSGIARESMKTAEKYLKAAIESMEELRSGLARNSEEYEIAENMVEIANYVIKRNK